MYTLGVMPSVHCVWCIVYIVHCMHSLSLCILLICSLSFHVLFPVYDDDVYNMRRALFKTQALLGNLAGTIVDCRAPVHFVKV